MDKGRILAVKRGIDVFVSSALLIILSPVFLVISIALLLQQGQPLFFRQERAGRYGVPFILRKFRTMSFARGEDGELLPDAKRVTPLGRFLRRTSLDELPELLN